MFDASQKYLDREPGQFVQIRPVSSKPAANMDPVDLLRVLEDKLAHSEQVLQDQISELSVRLSRLENDVGMIGTDSAPDLRNLERRMGVIADRLAKLEDRAA